MIYKMTSSYVICIAGLFLSLGVQAQSLIFEDNFEAPDAETYLTGTVWAPGNAPGNVPENEEIPVFLARVRLTATQPDPVPQTVHCVDCLVQADDGVLTDKVGKFKLPAEPGDYWLSIRKGFFEIQRQITIVEGINVLSSQDTTLPSVTEPDEGKWAPSIALAIGSYDRYESILGKLGFGSVDESGAFNAGSGVGLFDLYTNNGNAQTPGAVSSLTNLVENLTTMRLYHIIIIPGSGTNNTAALQNQQNLKNIRDWVSEGGWLVVSEWSGEWHDNIFPSRVEFTGINEDTPASAYSAETDTWNTSQFQGADGPSFGSQISSISDPDLKAWLEPQSGPTTGSSSTTDFDTSAVNIPDIWGSIDQLTVSALGVDSEGQTIFDTPQVWAQSDYGDAIGRPTTLSYRAGSCGRVWYSTGKMAMTNNHTGLIAHERISVYSLLDAGRCVIPAQ